ncbi:MAG: YvcK family protein [bacterium]|nr:YvcK family protein [bacterium]
MKNIVTVGGGTGSYTVLSGLKNLEGINIAAIVSMADDGGSNKVMRDELGVLPPSDTRLCLVALSEHTDIVRKLMLYRFSEGTLAGNTFGNIFLAALEKVTGDFSKGVEVASEILKVKGSVVPVTRAKAELSARLPDGTIISGEHAIDEADLEKAEPIALFYKDDVPLNDLAGEAIRNADYIIVGPGDFYTSLAPNLIVRGFREAIVDAKAKIILPLNLTNKQGHNMGWRASDYVNNLEKYMGRKADFILVNSETPYGEQIEQYKVEERGDVLIKDDLDDERVIRAPLLSKIMYENSKGDVMKRSFIRHDSEKLAQAIENIIK